MLSLIFTWIVLRIGFVGCFLDLDELKNINYGIDISDTPLLHPTELPSDAVILSSKYGQLYQCTYPPMPSQVKAKDSESQANNISITELLNPMKQLPCLFSNKGWWTYEFCYGREIKQYHTEDGKIVGDVIILGEYDVRNDIVNDSQKEDIKRQKSVERHHRHFYINGTLCDLTGRMREAEVRFVCQEGHGDFMSSVDERETCSYVVSVHTSRICTHPLFASPISVKSLPISCSPLLSASDYEMYMKEFQADVVNKVDSAAAGDGQLGTNGESTGVVKKLLLESMLKSVQAMLKQQHSSQQPDSDSAEVTAEVTSPDLETDGVTSQSASDDTEVDKAGVERTEAESDVSLSVAHSSARTSHDESEISRGDSDEADADAGSSASSEDDGDDSRVDEDEEDENEDYLTEFENEMKDIASTSLLKARLAKYKDTIASAMQAQFSNILQEAQADMARQGEDPADTAVDTDDAFKNLAKTLNLLLERLEQMKTDTAHEKAGDGSSVDGDGETESRVGATTDERETTETTADDGLQQSSGDADDSIEEKQQLGEKGSSDSETSEEADKVASKGDDGVGEAVDKEIPAEQETVRDRLEKAGIRSSERKLDMKIITFGTTEYASVQLFSDEDGSPTGRVFITIIGEDDEAVKEQERNQRLEENYQFKWNKNENGHR